MFSLIHIIENDGDKEYVVILSEGENNNEYIPKGFSPQLYD